MYIINQNIIKLKEVFNKYRYLFTLSKKIPLKIKLNYFFGFINLFLIKSLSLLLVPILRKLSSSELLRNLVFSSFQKDNLLICNTKEGLKYALNSSDKVISKSIYSKRQSFDAQLIEKVVEIVGKKNILIDVGANIGTIGIFAVKKGLFNKCIAFEPEPENFKLLKTNTLLNDCLENFEIYNLALSDNNEEDLEFELSDKNFGDHRVRVTNEKGFLNEERRKVIKVKTNFLDNFADNFDMSEIMIFIDTQGFEGHILNGSKKFLSFGVPIVFEFTPNLLKRANGIEKLYSALQNANYSKLYILNYSYFQRDFSIDVIKELENNLGTTQGLGYSADILII